MPSSIGLATSPSFSAAPAARREGWEGRGWWNKLWEGSVCRGGKKPGFRVPLGVWCGSVAAGWPVTVAGHVGCATCARRLVGCNESPKPCLRAIEASELADHAAKLISDPVKVCRSRLPIKSLDDAPSRAEEESKVVWRENFPKLMRMAQQRAVEFKFDRFIGGGKEWQDNCTKKIAELFEDIRHDSDHTVQAFHKHVVSLARQKTFMGLMLAAQDWGQEVEEVHEGTDSDSPAEGSDEDEDAAKARPGPRRRAHVLLVASGERKSSSSSSSKAEISNENASEASKQEQEEEQLMQSENEAGEEEQEEEDNEQLTEEERQQRLQQLYVEVSSFVKTLLKIDTAGAHVLVLPLQLLDDLASTVSDKDKSEQYREFVQLALGRPPASAPAALYSWHQKPNTLLADELTSGLALKDLPRIKIGEKYISLEEYLKAQLLLTRADCFFDVAKAVQQLQEPDLNRHLKKGNVMLLDQLVFCGLKQEGPHVVLMLRGRLEPSLISSKHMVLGNLLALSTNGRFDAEHLYFGTITSVPPVEQLKRVVHAARGKRRLAQKLNEQMARTTIKSRNARTAARR
eukprot:g50405.t1